MSFKLRSVHLLPILFLLFSLQACIDEGPSEPADLPESVSASFPTAAPAVESGSSDITVTQDFSAEVQVVATRGATATFEVSVSAVRDVPRAVITILMPEVHAAERTRWDDGFRLPLNQSLPPHARETRPITAGEAATLATTVRIPTPGVYRLLVRAESDGPTLRDMEVVAPVFSHEFWFVKRPDGSIALTADRPQLAEWQGNHRAGPFVNRVRAPRGASFLGGLARVKRLFAPSTGYVWEVVYFDQDAQVFRPVTSGASAEYTLIDLTNGEELSVEQELTDSNGRFTVGCMADDEGYEGTVSLGNGQVVVSGGSGSFDGDGGRPCDGSVDQVGVGSMHGEVFNNMSAIALATSADMQKSRSAIKVELDSGSGSSYNSFFDRIKLSTSSVWGGQGLWIQAHEYGHAFHEKALGPNAAAGACPSPHFINGSTNLQCAFSEGFANWIGAIRSGHSFGGWSIEANTFLGASSDGSIMESAVASLLYDLTDPVNDDGVEYPASYIADLMQSCAMINPNSRNNGIDHLIYCLENQVDPAVKNSSLYFTTRLFDPSSYVELASEPSGWSPAAIRTVWRQNLYNGR